METQETIYKNRSQWKCYLCNCTPQEMDKLFPTIARDIGRITANDLINEILV